MNVISNKNKNKQIIIMASEDYMIGEVNISVFAAKAKQQYGHCNFFTAKGLLKQYSIKFEEVEQGLKFTINDQKYIYWSKKNRVYKGIKNTDLTLKKFIKDNQQHFIKKEDMSEDLFYFGKYQNETIDYVIQEDIRYIDWLIENFKCKNTKDENFIEIIKKRLFEINI